MEERMKRNEKKNFVSYILFLFKKTAHNYDTLI